MKLRLAAIAALSSALVSATQNASVSTICPVHDICYSLSIPEDTAASGQGDIFFQIRAGRAYQWAALGQGSQMSGSNIFVVYAGTDGKITLSPRLGVGHVQPLHDEDAKVSLLSGSGVDDQGRMVANVKCSNCQAWKGGSMNFQEDTANWLYAWRQGTPLHSDEVTRRITQHSHAYAITWPIRNAKGRASANPFLDTDATDTTVTGGVGGWIKQHVAILHGGLAAAAFAILFPLGGILIRLANFRGGIWIHVVLQILSWLIWLVAFGLGVYMVTYMPLSGSDVAHPVIGGLLFVLLLGQPIYGWIHHKLFRKYARRTRWSYTHINIGRISILLGMINGGLGLMLAGVTDQKIKIIYGAVAGVMAVLYFAAIIFGERRVKFVEKLNRPGRPQMRYDKEGNATLLGSASRSTTPQPGLGMRRLRDSTSTEYAPLATQELYKDNAAGDDVGA